jgi:hypothetical protein
MTEPHLGQRGLWGRGGRQRWGTHTRVGGSQRASVPSMHTCISQLLYCVNVSLAGGTPPAAVISGELMQFERLLQCRLLPNSSYACMPDTGCINNSRRPTTGLLRWPSRRRGSGLRRQPPNHCIHPAIG